MNPSAIFTALKTQLQNSSDLSYVNDANIHLGKQENIANYPVIVIEPDGERKISDEYPQETWVQKVIIAAGIKSFNADQQIVGSGSIKGIADFRNDIKKALSSDYTLGGACELLNMLGGLDDTAEDYPIRGFTINLEIQYTQDIVTRA